MYKALIIDDEEPARRAIKALGAWESLGFTELLEAWNGQMGLEPLTEHQPDLVFVDMRMPLLGGVEFLEKAHDRGSAKFIVISGYDDFPYARSAIQAGALDYLLKPIKKQELNEALHKVAALLEQEREQQNREREEMIFQNISSPLLKEKIYSSIIEQNGRFHRMKELESLVDPASGEHYYTIVVTILNLADVCGSKFRGDLPACYYALTNATNEPLEGLGQAFSFKSGRDDQEMVVVLSSSRLLTPRKAKDELETVLMRMKETFGVEAMAAMSTAPAPLADLDASYQKAKAILLQADLIHIAPVHVEETPAASRPERPSLLKKKDLLLHALDTGSTLYAAHVLQEFFSDLHPSGLFTVDDMLKTEAELRLMLEQMMTETHNPAVDFGLLRDQYTRLFAYPVMPYEVFIRKASKYFDELFHVFFKARSRRIRWTSSRSKLTSI
ncbi:response regulator [Paenibacillus sp. P26]|nr:response regulator [Paenibacillus sp. P26]